MTDAPPPSASPANLPVHATARAKRKTASRRRLDRREACFELLSSGYSHRQIADALKISIDKVRRDVERAIGERRLDAPDRYIHFQVDRLTRALRSADDRIERGDMKAVLPLLRLVGALDRYHGLDPQRRRDPLPSMPLRSMPQPAPALAPPHEFSLQTAEKDTQPIENGSR